MTTVSLEATREFMERKLADSRRAKRLSGERLQEKLDAVGHRFHTKPLGKHQPISFLLGIKYPSYLFFLDPGLGKTWVILNLIKYRRRLRQIRRALVCVPNISNVDEWYLQAKEHTPTLKVVKLEGSVADRWELIQDSDAVVYVITYQGLLQMCSVPKRDVVSDEEDLTDDDLKGWIPDAKACERISRAFQFFAFDESHKYIASHTSLSFRIFLRVLRRRPFRYALTGTSWGKCPSELWSQFRLVDDGETLGRFLGVFRAAFFLLKTSKWTRYGEYVFRKLMKTELNRMLAHRSILFEDSEVNDLPKLLGGVLGKGGLILRRARISQEQWDYYQNLQRIIREAKGDVEITQSTYHQARQVTAGYISTKTKRGDPIEVRFSQNPKLEALIAFLRNELPMNRKVIVFHIYNKSGDVFSDGLKKARVQHVRLYGKTPRAQRRQALEDFRHGTARVLLASEAAAVGLNLQVANWICFLESPPEPKARVQVERRIWRTGQKRRCFILDFVISNSVDVRVARCVKERRSFYESLMRGKETL